MSPSPLPPVADSPTPMQPQQGIAAGQSRTAAAAAEELDVWWGSYSGWALLPSTLACVILTGLIAIASLSWLPRGWMQPTFLLVGSVVWFIQGLLAGYRYFSFNYRLTTRRLFRDKGFLYPEFLEVDLARVSAVAVKRSGLDSLFRTGKIIVHVSDANVSLVLEGVRHPYQVTETIRDAVQKARAAGP